MRSAERSEKPSWLRRWFFRDLGSGRIQDPADRVTAFLHFHVHRVQFDHNGVAAEFLGDLPRRAAAGEGVEDDFPFRTAGENTRPHKILGKDRVMWSTT
jgi:hypothetical protein